ncbi:MAG: hypothetical protein Q8932_12025 [Bacteroidota bacterium]|nr:hypothetical protein [Bacteroidota bacterium]MDP4246564.1 hypothetical protein [Bacteroidota bacterium]MDP4260431.1 hypothetical protein [Bacteroidota bacterium]
MRIDINQQKISLGERYDVFIDGQASYRASSSLFRILRVINLYTVDGDQPLLTIKRRWSFIIKKYDIVRKGELYRFRVVKFWRRHLQCAVGKDLYDIYGHRSRKFSVYKNDVQVAWWEESRVTWFKGDNYAMLADNDGDREMLIAFCLIIDDSHSRKKHGAVNIHLGYIGPEDRPFNPSWTPKGFAI